MGTDSERMERKFMTTYWIKLLKPYYGSNGMVGLKAGYHRLENYHLFFGIQHHADIIVYQSYNGTKYV